MDIITLHQSYILKVSDRYTITFYSNLQRQSRLSRFSIDVKMSSAEMKISKLCVLYHFYKVVRKYKGRFTLINRLIIQLRKFVTKNVVLLL